jgi:phage gp36-like protein
MAHPYGTRAGLEKFLGATLTTALATLPGSEADDVIDQAREDADNEIDAALAQRYEVPFAAVTDVPPTPGIIQTISNNLTAANVFEKRHPNGTLENTYREKAETLLARLLDGTYEVPGAAKVSATAGSVGIRHAVAGEGPVFAGYDPDYDDTDRMSGW